MIESTDIIKSRKWIWVKFQRSGFHYYPDAQHREDLQDVAYLGSRHRHLFKFRVQIEVDHDDRELEFHQVLNYCESLFDNNIDIDNKSVEMLANDVYNKLSEKYPHRDMKIEVSEDGECGCIMEYSLLHDVMRYRFVD